MTQLPDDFDKKNVFSVNVFDFVSIEKTRREIQSNSNFAKECAKKWLEYNYPDLDWKYVTKTNLDFSNLEFYKNYNQAKKLNSFETIKYFKNSFDWMYLHSKTISELIYPSTWYGGKTKYFWKASIGTYIYYVILFNCGKSFDSIKKPQCVQEFPETSYCTKRLSDLFLDWNDNQ